MLNQPTSLLAALMVTLGSFAWAEETPAPAPKKAEIVSTAEQKAKAADLAKSYPLTTCVVSHDKVGGSNDTVDALYDGRLIRFCCKGCVKSFNKKPEKYLKELDAAAKPSA